MPPWWWFTLPAEGGTRYAPFEARASDTKKSVQTRIVKHYEQVLAIKARPVHPRPQWQRPAARPAAATTAPEAAVALKS